MSQAAMFLGLVVFVAGAAATAAKNGWLGAILLLVGLALIAWGLATV